VDHLTTLNVIQKRFSYLVGTVIDDTDRPFIVTNHLIASGVVTYLNMLAAVDVEFGAGDVGALLRARQVG
jgi:hypothetical protein